MQEDKFFKAHELTQKAIMKYQDRLLPIYLKHMAFLVIALGLFSFIFFDVIGKVEIGVYSQEVKAMAYLFYGLITIVLLVCISFISYAYFIPDSHLYRPVVYEYESTEVLMHSTDFSLTDFDDLFLHMEVKIEGANSHEETIRYLILKQIFNEKIKSLIESDFANNDSLHFRSRHLNDFI